MMAVKMIFQMCFFNWDSLHVMLNRHYMSYKKKKHEKSEAYKKYV